ncbi:MAG: DUF177 domain-containing protein [Chloroflexota bacterium]
MSGKHSNLRFNFGFLIEADLGSSREMGLSYPTIRVSDDLTLSPLEGNFIVTRTGEGIYIGGTLKSVLELECMRCLIDTRQPINFKLDDLFYYPPESAPKGELVLGEDGYIDLAPLVRELGLLEVPIQPICREDCQGLCMVCGQNFNEDNCDCEEDNIDPRMAALKKLLD